MIYDYTCIYQDLLNCFIKLYFLILVVKKNIIDFWPCQQTTSDSFHFSSYPLKKAPCCGEG